MYFTGRENIEGYVVLVNAFLYQMRRESLNAAVINIDNHDESLD